MPRQSAFIVVSPAVSATGQINVLDWEETGVTVTVNGIAFQEGVDFIAEMSNGMTAEALAAAITAADIDGIESAVYDSGHIGAVIIVTADPGAAGNGIAMSSSAPADYSVDANLSGGADAVTESRVEASDRVPVSTGRRVPFNFQNSLTFSSAGNSYGGVTAPADVMTSNLTLEWWVAFDVVPAGTTPIFSLATSDYYIGYNVNSLFVSYADSGGVQRFAQSLTMRFLPKNWYHFAVTFTTVGSNVDVSTYFNGVLSNTTSRTDGHSAVYGGNLYLGAFSPGALNIDGKMANVGFYSRALTAEEITMRSRSLPVTSGNIHRWLFSEGSGGTLADSIGSTNFSLVNSPVWSPLNVPTKPRVTIS